MCDLAMDFHHLLHVERGRKRERERFSEYLYLAYNEIDVVPDFMTFAVW